MLMQVNNAQMQISDISDLLNLLTPTAVICNFWHPGTLTLRSDRQSAPMSKITNDGLTQSGTGCSIAVTVWQQWASNCKYVLRQTDGRTDGQTAV